MTKYFPKDIMFPLVKLVWQRAAPTVTLTTLSAYRSLARSPLYEMLQAGKKSNQILQQAVQSELR